MLLAKVIMLLWAIWLPIIQNGAPTTAVGTVMDEYGLPITYGVVRLAPVDSEHTYFACFIEDTVQCPGMWIQENGNVSIPVHGEPNPYGYVVAIGKGDTRDPWQVITDTEGHIIVWNIEAGKTNDLGTLRIWRDVMFTPTLNTLEGDIK